MKKSVLLGCIATFALSASIASAEVITPSSDEVKTAFASFLNTQTQAGTLFDLDKMTVTAQGNGFDISIPAISDGQMKLSAQTVHLTYAGDFNNHAQYKIESPFEAVQNLIKEILPNAAINAESAELTTVWVPAYNIISKNSQNIKGLKVSIPNMLDLSAGSLISDSLARVVGTDKMDSANTSDGRDIQVSVENGVVVVPSFSYESILTGSDITSDPIQQMLSCDNNTVKYTVPDVQLKMQGASAPMGSFSIVGQGSYQNEVLRYESKISNINSPTLGAFAPAALVPDEISVDLSFEGVPKTVLSQLVERAQDKTFTDQDVPLLKQAMDTGIIRINRIEAKNTLAGIAVSGTIRLQLENAETVTTVDGIQENLKPDIDAKVVITNLDKISPEPKVNQDRCDLATQQVQTIDMSAPDAASQKSMAEMQRDMACSPQGGPLDMVRPYLDMNNRVVGTDGTTTDTLIISFDGDVLTVNGHKIQ
ncbi:MAG: hypothetical protein SPL08_05020 [Pseudomonadota bacterium]|nr:hypothetical protein [Pseudomonadota bacterium]